MNVAATANPTSPTRRTPSRHNHWKRIDMRWKHVVPIVSVVAVSAAMFALRLASAIGA
jgi:hypothetical protein